MHSSHSSEGLGKLLRVILYELKPFIFHIYNTVVHFCFSLVLYSINITYSSVVPPINGFFECIASIEDSCARCSLSPINKYVPT
jgi:hypothetical protein